jgi:LmbE family N-acetylglucosaminyl deacetylase
MASIDAVWEATVDRAALRRLRERLVASGRLAAEAWPFEQLTTLGLEGDDVFAFDVASYVDDKLAALAAHSSQTLEASTFIGIPAGAFQRLLTTEWYRVTSAAAAAA